MSRIPSCKLGNFLRFIRDDAYWQRLGYKYHDDVLLVIDGNRFEDGYEEELTKHNYPDEQYVEIHSGFIVHINESEPPIDLYLAYKRWQAPCLKTLAARARQGQQKP